MNSTFDKIKEKALIESIINKDQDSFNALYSELQKEEYSKLVSNRFAELEGAR